MRVEHLSLVDFRNYRSAEVDFVAGANLVVGPNGQGKTNLVESIGYLSTLGSHRVSSDQALVRAGADAAIVRARLAHEQREVLLEVQLNRAAPNRAQLNRGAIKPRELPRHLASVVFAPEDLALVRGEPSGRRRFIDVLLVQKSPRFAGVISDYERVLKQRNSLLKSARALRGANPQLSTLEVWDDRLVALGSEIIDARLALVDQLREPVAAAYRAIAGTEHEARVRARLSIEGAQPDDDEVATIEASVERPATDIAAAFRTALASVRRAELDRGLTLVGPHRDDLLLELNGLPARGYASHGESWSFALALRLAAAEVLRHDSSLGDPVLILDDVFAELDEARRLRLSHAIGTFEQVIITAAVEGDVPDPLRGHRILVAAGEIVEPS